MPCPYANVLGVPGEGIHAPRIFGLARNDLLMTILAAVLTAYSLNISFILSFTLWFVTGEVLHYLFGTDTAFLKMLGISPKC